MLNKKYSFLLLLFPILLVSCNGKNNEQTECNHIDINPKDHLCDNCSHIISNHVDENEDFVCDYCEKEFFLSEFPYAQITNYLSKESLTIIPEAYGNNFQYFVRQDNDGNNYLEVIAKDEHIDHYLSKFDQNKFYVEFDNFLNKYYLLSKDNTIILYLSETNEYGLDIQFYNVSPKSFPNNDFVLWLDNRSEETIPDFNCLDFEIDNTKSNSSTLYVGINGISVNDLEKIFTNNDYNVVSRSSDASIKLISPGESLEIIIKKITLTKVKMEISYKIPVIRKWPSEMIKEAIGTIEGTTIETLPAADGERFEIYPSTIPNNVQINVMGSLDDYLQVLEDNQYIDIGSKDSEWKERLSPRGTLSLLLYEIASSNWFSISVTAHASVN